VPLKPTASALLKNLQPFHADSHFALAVSGGGDSMGLLALAAQAGQLDGAPRFTVLTVNHGLRQAAAAEAAHVAAQCATLNLPHVTLMADKKLGASDMQQQARNLRYRLMAAWCAQHQAQGLVLAHHQDDQAETVLMRMARGSGMSGLSGMAARQLLQTEAAPILLLRPLLKYRGTDVKALAHEAGLPVINDPSNDDPQFERVRWRRLLPLLQAEGLGAARLAEIADDMRLMQTALDNKLTAWLDHYALWHDYGVLRLPRADFDALPMTQKQRFIGRFVQYFGQYAHPVKQKKTDRLLHHIDDTAHGAASVGGLHMRWRKGHLFLGREAAACEAAVPMNDIATRFNGRFDRRFAIIGTNLSERERKNLHIGPLDPQGVADMRARGAVFDKTVPAAYYAALPGVFDGNRLIDCPPLSCSLSDLDAEAADFQMHSVYYNGFYRDILRAGRKD
jgi:tRNA(Ile)-lysidine synthase